MGNIEDIIWPENATKINQSTQEKRRYSNFVKDFLQTLQQLDSNFIFGNSVSEKNLDFIASNYINKYWNEKKILESC